MPNSLKKTIHCIDYQSNTITSNLEAGYESMLSELRKTSSKENLHFKPTIPKLSDLQLIRLVILAKFKSIDSEYQLFREIKGFKIESKMERIVYNKRKRKLFPFMEEIGMKITSLKNTL